MIRSSAIFTSTLAGLVVGAGIFYPLGSLIAAALKQSGWAEFFKLWVSSEVISTVALTLSYSLTALLAAFLISLPLSLILNRNHSRRFRVGVEAALQVMWVLPSFLYALLIIAGFRQIRRVDPTFELYSMRTVWVAWTVIAIPFLTLSFLRALRDLDPREAEMMQVFGADQKKRLMRYYWPRLSPMIRSALLHQMWLYLTSFTLVMILGGGPPYETLEVGVYTSVRLDQLNYSRAVGFSAWQLAILISLRYLLSRKHASSLEGRVGVEWMEHDTAKTKHFKSGIRGWYWVAIALIIAFCVRALLMTEGLAEAFVTGVALSGMTAILSLGYTFFVFYLKQRWLAELGAWVSPMVLSLAWWKAYAFSAPSIALCILIQVILLSPWIARVFYPVLARTRVGELEAVRTLGASPFTAWHKVEWPRVRAQAKWMLALVFGLSLSEVSTVILFSRGDFEPLSVWIQNQMSRFQFASAFEGTLVLVGISILALMVVKRRSTG